MKRIILIFLCLFMLCACTKEKRTDRTIYAMDTVMNISVYDCSKDLLVRAEEEIHALENKLSVSKTDSEIYTLNKNGTLVSPSQELLDILSVADTINKETDGAFDITIYPILKAWGFTTPAHQVPDEATIGALIKNVGMDKIFTDENTITLSPGTQIDLGGIAKGYACDSVVKLLKDEGKTSALLDLGGNVYAIGSKPDGTPWKIAVRDPKSDGTIGTLNVRDTALVTSGGYQRYFEHDGMIYHHILDPKTGHPAQSGLLSVTIVCDDATVSDALSTALFVLGKDGAISYWRTQKGTPFEMILVTDDNRIIVTENLKDSFSATGTDTYTYEYVDRQTNPY